MTFPVGTFDADVVETLQAFYDEGLKTVALVYESSTGTYDPETDAITDGTPVELDGVVYGQGLTEDANGAPQEVISFAYRYADHPNPKPGLRFDFRTNDGGLWQLKEYQLDPSRSAAFLECTR